MTIKNIKTGFRITGVCPFNEYAIVLPGDKQLENTDRSQIYPALVVVR